MNHDASPIAASLRRHYSGVLVYTPTADMSRCIEQLELLPGVEVHHTDANTGRVIAVLESDHFGEQEALLRRVQMSSHVLLAELVYYRRDDEPANDTSAAHVGEGTGRTGQ